MPNKNNKQYLLHPNESWLSRAFFLYLFKLNSLGSINNLSPQDFFNMHPRMTHDVISKEFDDYCKSRPSDAPFSQNFVRYLNKVQWFGAFTLGATASVEMINPFLIRALIRWIQDEEFETWKGPAIASGIFIVSFIKTYGFRLSTLYCTWNEGRISSIGRSNVFKRILKMKSATLGQVGKGFMNNIVVGDIQLLYSALFFSNAILSVPFILIPQTAILVYEFGYAGFLSPILFFLVSIIQYSVSVSIKKSVGKRKLIEDLLGKKISEIARGAKEIKQNAWEAVYIKDIHMLRKDHSMQYFTYNLKFMITTYFSMNTVYLIAFCIMLVLKLQDKLVTLEDNYFLISLCFTIYYPIRLIANSFNLLQASGVIMERFNKFMMTEPEETNLKEKSQETVPKGSIRFESISANWIDSKVAKVFPSDKKSGVLAIKDITFTFTPGKLYAVIGEIGSGKSSLLQSALGELYFSSGQVVKNGEIAFVPQEAYLINATLRKNITFFKDHDEERYIETLARCCLLDDLLTFNALDLIEIGERGINLSGGQKQRISLARALYSNRDIYLIDDALSALDAEVGKIILNEVFIDALAGKTRIIVTHATYLLDQVDEVVLMKNGKIVANGPFDYIKDTLEYKEYDEHQHKADLVEEEEKEPEGEIDSINEANGKEQNDHKSIKLTLEERKQKIKEALARTNQFEEKNEKEGRITKEEGMHESHSHKAHYCEMIMNGGIISIICYIVCLFLHNGANNAIQFLMGEWATEQVNPNRYAIYSGVSLAIIYLSSALACYFVGLYFKRLTTQGLVKLMRMILRRPMKFFDMTPVGQIIERAIGDRESMDFELTTFSQFIAHGVIQMIFLLGNISFNSPVLILVFILLM